MSAWTKVIVVIVVLASSMVHAERDYSMDLHGTTCQPVFGGYGDAAYGEPGIGNFSSTNSLRVFCPVNLAQGSENSFSPKIHWVDVAYADGNGVVPFWCYVWATDLGASGAEYWSPRSYTCSNSFLRSGCLDSTTEYTGVSDIFFWKPFGDQTYNWLTMGVSCSIPPSGAAGVSWVTGYSAVTIPWDQP